MTNQLYIIIGAYGSGKSEYAIHYARQLNKQGNSISLVDLDVVNPYFRTRDVQDILKQDGIEVIAPEGHFKYADLPMISPRIKGVIENQDKTVILDVGGDPAGCRALGRFVEPINTRGYWMTMVINTNRPFTSSPEEIIKMHQMLEFTSKLSISEYVSNTNLMQYTDKDIVLSGIRIIQEAADKLNVVFMKYLVLDNYNDIVPDGILDKTREIMQYTLKKPWEL